VESGIDSGGAMSDNVSPIERLRSGARTRFDDLDDRTSALETRVEALESSRQPEPAPQDDCGRDHVPAEVHERGWQWRPVGDGAFAPPFGTILQCPGCGALVGGGPTWCVRCAKERPPAPAPVEVDVLVEHAHVIEGARPWVGEGDCILALRDALVECRLQVQAFWDENMRREREIADLTSTLSAVRADCADWERSAKTENANVITLRAQLSACRAVGLDDDQASSASTETVVANRVIQLRDEREQLRAQLAAVEAERDRLEVERNVLAKKLAAIDTDPPDTGSPDYLPCRGR
jgi:hypothetical protein